MSGKEFIFSGEYFKAAFEATPGSSVLLLPDAPLFTVVAVTEAYLQHTHYSKDQLINKGIFETSAANPADLNDDGAKKLFESFTDVLKNKTKQEMPSQRYDVANVNGKYAERYWKAINQPVLDTEGNVQFIVHTAEEITAQVKIRQSESLIKGMQEVDNIFKNAPFAIHIFKGPDLVVEMANEATAFLWEKQIHDVLGKPLAEIFPGIEKSGFTEILQRVMSTGEIDRGFEKGFGEMNSGQKFFNYLFQPYFEAGSNTATGVLAFVSDVTKKVQSEKALTQSEQRFQQIANSLPLVVWTASPEGGLTFISKQWESFYGNPVTESLGTGWASFVHEDDIQAAAEKWKHSLETGKDYETEFRVRHKKDGYHWLLVRAVPFRNEAGEITEWYGSNTDIDGNKKAEEKVKESEQKFRSVIDSAPFPIGVYTGKEMRISIANKAMTDAWGKGENVIGKLYTEILPELDNQQIFDQLADVYNTGDAFHAKNTKVDILVNGKLQSFFFNYSFTPLYDAAGNVYGVMNTAAEVTDLNVAIFNAKESEYRYRTLIEESSVATALYIGRELRIRYANDIMVGYWQKDERVIGKTLAEAVPELEGQPFLQMLDDVYTSGKALSGEGAKAIIEVNGEPQEFYFNFTYKALRNAEGEIYGIHHIAVDVTEEVLAKKELEENRNQLEFAIEATELGTFDYNPLTGKFSANHRLKEWFGLPPESALDLQHAIDAIADKDRQRVTEDIRNSLDFSSGGRYNTEYVIVNPLTKTEINVLAKGMVWFNEHNAAYRLTGTLQDITEQVSAMQKTEELVTERTKELAQANESLQRSNAELAQFAYVASHDLQEPLRKISVFTQMMGQHLIETGIDAQTQNFLTKIQNASARMTNLVRDVLVYSELSKINEAFQQTDLMQIAEGIKTDFELLIEQKNAEVIFKDLPVIEAIPLQMSQLFGNLISNSLKFSRKDVQPVISIKAKKLSESEKQKYAIAKSPDTYYNIEISDNGIGFNSEYAQQIFNIFQRLHGKSAYSGTGIGLAMCKKIAVNHRGDIFADAAENKGAVFNVILPEKQGGL